MDDEQFTTAVKCELDELKDRYGYSDDEAFVHWCAKQIYSVDDDICEAACEIGGSNDKGIDALWVDDTKGRVIIIQGKYSEVNRSIGRGEISNLKAIPALLLDQEFIVKQKNVELKEKSADYRDAINNGLSTELVLCVFGKITPSAMDESNQFNTNSEDNKQEMIILDFKKLKNMYIENLTRDEEISGPESIDLIPNQYFKKEDLSVKSVVATIKAKELSRIARKYGYALFQKNIRSYLSERDKFNKKMIETLKSEQKHNFWHFNNGVSIVCEDYKLDEEKNIVNLDNIQIVNGCQTTSTLLVADRQYDILDDKVHILVRIIASHDKNFTDKITETTNSQAEIKTRDFRSNDEIQKQLENSINKINGFMYIRKRGKEKSLSPTQKRTKEIIDMELAAQTILAFILEKPSEAKSEKSFIFTPKSESGYYDEIFNKDRSAEEVVFSYLCYKLIEDTRKKWRCEKKKLKLEIDKNQKAGNSTEDLEKQIETKEYLLHADFHILALIHHLLIKKYKLLNDGTIKKIRTCDNFNEISLKLYEKATTFLSACIGDVKMKDFDFSHTKYFKSRQNYAVVRDYVDRRINEIEIVTGHDIFENIAFP
ncbi:MAG: AIPR family protein [Nanoarchaeota archaeon]